MPRQCNFLDSIKLENTEVSSSNLILQSVNNKLYFNGSKLTGNETTSSESIYTTPDVSNVNSIISYFKNEFGTSSFFLNINPLVSTSNITYSSSTATNIPNSNFIFVGGVLVPSGNVIFIPQTSSNIGIYDPVNDIFSSGASVAPLDNFRFRGGVLAPNGNVIMAPSRSDYVGIYDPETDTYTDGATTSGPDYAFNGCVLAPNGKVILVPQNNNNIGIYDPETDTYTNGPDVSSLGTNKFEGGVLAPNGKVILIPQDNNNIGIYDPETDTYTNGPDVSSLGTNKFGGGVLAPNGLIYMIPDNGSSLGIYDPVKNILSESATISNGRRNSGCLSADGRIVLCPTNSSVDITIYDPVTDTSIDIAHSLSNDLWEGCVLTHNGDIILIPSRRSSPNGCPIGILNYTNTNQLYNSVISLSPYFNKY